MEDEVGWMRMQKDDGGWSRMKEDAERWRRMKEDEEENRSKFTLGNCAHISRRIDGCGCTLIGSTFTNDINKYINICSMQ